ncbi:MAG TPA: hypothetical protein VH559_11135 [Gemmatimonadaceae bacterium]
MPSVSPRNAVVLLAVVACSRDRPVRLVAGLHDTVVINSARAEAIPVDAVDRAGHRTPARNPRFELISGDRIAISDRGDVHCVGRGDATVRASIGALSTIFRLFCRPLRGFAFDFRSYGLFIGGPPQQLDIVAEDLNGQPETLLVVQLRVRDSSVVRIERDLIVAKRPGATWVDVQAGDSRRGYYVQVLARANSSSGLRPYEAFIQQVTLTNDAGRSWPITPGRYEIRFIPNDERQGSALFAVTNANCSRYFDHEPHLSCVAGENAQVVAGIGARSRRTMRVTGRLVLRRLADPPSVIDYIFDVGNYAAMR